ncbi:MAG: hypothetical protein HXY41_11455 [Chloroflexi bacterium]|nr:hypothetical protein [Chloroflexota bacterium]
MAKNRYFLARWMAALGVFVIASAQVMAQPDPCADPANPVVAENCQPGTDEWITRNPIGDIYGYASADSVNRGDSVDFLVDTGSPTFDIRIYRNGYYGGLGGRLVQTIEAVPGQNQPDCWQQPDTGLTSCGNWAVSYTLNVPEEWVSGVYIARIIRPDTGGDNYILFVVRDDERDSAILYQQSVSTFQAYNNFGGKSVYSSGSGFCTTVTEASRAAKVSYNRPYNQSMADPNSYFRAEYPMVRWLEQQGYDVAYSTTSDTHRSGQPGAANELLDHQAFFSVGHDEYWTLEMWNAIESARDAGVHLGFFTANTAYWRIRMEDDPITGEPDSVMVTYKTIEGGPADPSGFSTSTWRDPEGPNQPENGLVGVMYIGDNDSLFFPMRITADKVSERIYRHTGLEAMPPDTYINVGDHIFGWEWDAVADNGHSPDGIEILAESPVYGLLLQDAGKFENGMMGLAGAHTTRYTASSGALVFASGTIQWSWGLGAYAIQPQEPEPIITQMTYNVLADMGLTPATPAGVILDGSDAQPAPIDPSRFLPLDAPAPVIMDLKAEVDGDSVTISWKTDVETIGQVWFGGRAGHVIFPMAQDLEYRTEHSLTISDLTTPRDFKVGPAVFTTAARYFTVTASDRNWNTRISDEASFEVGTPPLNTQLRNTFNNLTQPARCFVRANPTLSIVIGVVAALVVLVLLAFGFLALRRRGRTAQPQG